MSYGTIIQSGSFISSGNAQTLQLRSDLDWMEVYNFTTAAAGSDVSTGVSFKWFRGMPVNDGIYEGYDGGAVYVASTCGALAVGGFNLIDSSSTALGAQVAVTAGTNVAAPVFTVAGIIGLTNGALVRLANTEFANLNGLDFTSSGVGAGTFTLANALSQAPGLPATTGTYRLVPFDALYYPRKRVIANITAAYPAVVTTLVDHGYTTGQSVRFSVPADEGMVELDNVQATVTVINAGTFSINVDTSAFTAFTFPLAANVPCNYAIVKPVGEDSVVAPNVLADATINTGYIGIQLAAGVQSPAGVQGNVIYWVAGKSENL
jgi:hypothetical protein